jgi:asparagine synthase (glutamine-hydrolysing)
MPGIAGIIKKQPYEGIQRDLSLMVESMRHETYYVGSQYVNPDVGAYIGWTSHPCSLVQLMPLVSSDNRRVLIVVGEHFSHDSQPTSPLDGGAIGASARDILQRYDESEDKFLGSLNGWFCGIAIDLDLRKITLFNDRYGMSRVYLYEGADEFIFASEAKSILRIRPALRTIDPGAMSQYLRYNCVMGNMTLFKGISLLPPASSWSFTCCAGPQKQKYFDYADWERQPTMGPKDFYEKFESTVSKVFLAYMDGVQPVAVSLTAGLDTRLILASVEDKTRPLPCYTFGGLWGETYDIRAARKLAAICNQPYEAIRISEQFLQEFPNYATKSVYISDGTHDAFGAHDVYFNEIAHRIAPIRLTGKFGSEVVRTRKLIPTWDVPRNLVQSSFLPFLDETPSFEHFTRTTHPLSRVVSEEIPWYEFGRVAVEQSKVIMRTPYMDNELVKLMYQAPPGVRSSRDLQIRYIKQKSHELGDLPTNMGRMGKDRDPMGKVIYSFFWALFKAEYVYLYAAPHWLTRVDRTLGVLRPERILAGKQKFECYRIWIKTHLAKSIRDILLNPQAHCTEFFDKASLEKMVLRHTAGTHNYLNEINKMLTVELIYSSLLKP